MVACSNDTHVQSEQASQEVGHWVIATEKETKKKHIRFGRLSKFPFSLRTKFMKFKAKILKC